jgi:hypothetical protein
MSATNAPANSKCHLGDSNRTMIFQKGIQKAKANMVGGGLSGVYVGGGISGGIWSQEPIPETFQMCLWLHGISADCPNFGIRKDCGECKRFWIVSFVGGGMTGIYCTSTNTFTISTGVRNDDK